MTKYRKSYFTLSPKQVPKAERTNKKFINAAGDLTELALRVGQTQKWRAESVIQEHLECQVTIRFRHEPYKVNGGEYIVQTVWIGDYPSNWDHAAVTLTSLVAAREHYAKSIRWAKDCFNSLEKTP